jgi:hypothetical protein
VLEEGNLFSNQLSGSFCSLSFQSDSEKPDMFGMLMMDVEDNLRISEKLGNISKMDEESAE